MSETARVARLAACAESYVIVVDRVHYNVGCTIRAQANEIDRLRLEVLRANARLSTFIDEARLACQSSGVEKCLREIAETAAEDPDNRDPVHAVIVRAALMIYAAHGHPVEPLRPAGSGHPVVESPDPL